MGHLAVANEPWTDRGRRAGELLRRQPHAEDLLRLYVALLEPQVARDYAWSLLAVDRELGWLPRWALYNTETNTMTGDAVTPFLVDLWARGLLNGYEDQFYGALRKNADGVPPRVVWCCATRSRLTRSRWRAR